MGMSDGETMERLWSYLRRFARMTKEMRPAHRIDVLSSALIYYGIQTKGKLGKLNEWVLIVFSHVTVVATLLLTRFERATRTKEIAEESFNQAISGSYEGK